MEGKCAEQKAHAVPPEYHLDLPLQGNYENIIYIEKSLVEGLSCALVSIYHLRSVKIWCNEVGLKYCSHGQKIKKDGEKFRNILLLIFHADTFHKSVLLALWNETLRVSVLIGYTKELAYL